MDLCIFPTEADAQCTSRPVDQTTRITDAQFPMQSDPSLGLARQRVGQRCKHRHAVEPMSLCTRLDWW